MSSQCSSVFVINEPPQFYCSKTIDFKHKQSQRMQPLFKFASPTADTLSANSRSPHPCPFCRCHPSNNPGNCLPNLYITTPSQPTDYMAMTFNPTPPLFAQTAPSLRPSPSLNKTNITFRYSSPLKVKALSVDNRFSTKKYKNSRFPHLTRNEVEDEPILQIVKNKPAHNSKQLESQQKTPLKHQILKMNKIKSKGKLEIDSKNSKAGSQASSSAHQIKSTQSNNQRQSKQQPQSHSQKQTPIDCFKCQTSPQNYQPNISKGTDSLGKKALNNQPLAQANSAKQSQITKMQLNKKYPTVKSIQMFKQPTSSIHQTPKPNRQFSRSENVSDTSLKIIQQKERVSDWRRQLLLYETDRQMASYLSEQLALNYDYFFANQESDRSLSAYLQL